jgi:beta-1,2-mannobiose phosphorylase / 1,2-beta-oligomannan phosphorylase
MIEVIKEGILLHKSELPFENEGVLNPGVIQIDGVIHVFYRAVSTGNHSSIGYCRLSDPLTVDFRRPTALLEPESSEESKGMEDPRIVKIDDTYFLTYTAYDGINALGSLATSEDLIHFDQKGVIVPQITYEQFLSYTRFNRHTNEKYSRYNNPRYHYENIGEETYLWDKNVIFFPRRIDGRLYFMHRIKPDVQIVVDIDSIDDLTPEFWKDYLKNLADHIVLAPKYDHEVNYIGGGCPPIETEAGWLLIYHGVHDTVKGYVYSACAALLDRDQPQKEIARLPYPLFFPEKPWELRGEVNNVCFPTGTAIVEDRLYIYYGAADERIAVAAVSLSGLLDELLQNRSYHETL